MLKHFLKVLKKTECGQAMVEFALAIPLVLAIICGILELGVACANKLEVANVCREATRYGIAYSADANNTALVQSKISQLATDRMRGKITSKITYSKPADLRTGDITVTVSYQATTLTPLAGIFSGDTYLVQSTCTMKMS